MGGYPINLWLEKNSNGASLQCLKQFLQDNETFSERLDMKALEEAATDLTNRPHDMLFDRIMKVTIQPGAGGFGKKRDWNTILFNAWAMAVLEGFAKGKNDIDMKAAARLLNVQTRVRKSTITTCISE